MFKHMEEKRIVWKPVVGYEGLYEVNNDCDVKSFNYNHTGKEKLLKPSLDKDGYKHYSLHKNGAIKNMSAHRIGMTAFIPNPDNLPCVNHKDENKGNNYIHINPDGTVDPDKSNLEWCSVSYNNNYGAKPEIIGEKLSKPVLQFSLSGEFIKEYKSAAEAERQTGVLNSGISMCCRGVYKTAGTNGVRYIWRYKDAS